MPTRRKTPRPFTPADRARARRNYRKIVAAELDLNRLAEERIKEYADLLDNHGGERQPPP